MTRKFNRMDFQRHWRNCIVEGQPVREWCRCVKSDAVKARCIYCNVSVRIGVNPAMSFTKHALSRRHKQNRKKVQLGLKLPADYATKRMKPNQAIAACSALYPGMNFNCSVNLLPLGVLHKPSNQVRSSDLVSLLQWLVRPEMKKAFIDVYICFHCGAEFTSRPTLQNHQRCCHVRSPELQAVTPLGNSHLLQHGYLTPPRSSAFYNAAGQTVFRSSINTRKQVTYPSVWPSKDSFITSLGLLPKKKVAQVCSKRRNTQCESIDLDDDIPISPTLPRTPKLLISHLSRDGSEKCGDNSPSRVRKSLFSSQQSQTDEEANSSKRNDDNDENKSEERSKISHAKSLYSLDLTSPLGQFVIKHIKGDPNLHVLSDVESHCLTLAPKINIPSIKLRDRHIIYPITFKGFPGKGNFSYIHLYKFTRHQKVEFLRRVNTGLDKNSRALLRTMKMCKVRLARLTRADLKRWMVSGVDVSVNLKPLTPEEIRFWTTPKEVPDTNSYKAAVFPCGLSFSSPNVNNVLGLKTCQDAGLCRRFSLSVANYVSEEACAEVTENRRAVYKSLLSDSSSCETADTGNSPALMPILRVLLTAPAVHTMPHGQVNSSGDVTESTVKMTSVSTSPTLSQAPYSPEYASSIKEGIQHYSHLLSVHRNTGYPRYAMENRLAVAPGTLHGISDQAVRNVPEEKAKLVTLGSTRSGRHSVYFRTALEGEAIQDSTTNCQSIFKGGKLSVKSTKTEQSTPERTRLVNRKSLMKSLDAVYQPSVKNTAMKRRLKGTNALQAKKRKVSTVPSVGRHLQKDENSLTEAGRESELYVSTRKCSESRKRRISHSADTTLSSSADKAFDKRFTIHSAYPRSEKQHNPQQFLMAESTLNGLESYNGDAFDQGVSHQIKQNENSKCPGCYGKRIPVASLLNGNAENHRCIICQHSNADRSLHLKKLHQDLKVVNGKHGRSSKHNKHASKGTETNLAIKKSKHISHLRDLDEAERTNRIESSLAVSPAADSNNSKAIKIAKKSFLMNSSSEPSSSQKDVSPNGIRLVIYSSPSSPQLRQSSLINTISIPRKAEVRKSLLSSFLLKSK